MDFAFR